MNVILQKSHLAVFVFVIGILISYLLWDSISLPFVNPLGVVGYCTKIQFNPQNDVLRFGLFLGLPSFLLLLVSFLGRKWLWDKSLFTLQSSNEKGKIPSSKNSRWFTVLPIFYAVLIALNAPTYHSFGRFDAYHEGESLGSAESFLKGEKPYADFVFFHGLIQDPLRSVWAFGLWGRSIGAERTIESGMKVLAWIFLALFIRKLFQNSVWWTLGSLSVLALAQVSFCFNVFGSFFIPELTPEHMVQAFLDHQDFWKCFNFLIVPSRDVLTFILGLVWLSLFEFLPGGGKRASWQFRILSVLFFLGPLMALGYSVDRGVYLSVISFLLFFVFVFHLTERSRKEFLIFSGTGFLLGLMGLTFLLQGQWAPFFEFTFNQMPKFKELSEKIPYPIHQLKFLFACVLIAAHGYRLVWIGLGSTFSKDQKSWWKPFIQKHLIELTLYAMSVFYFRNVLARSDEEHLIYSLLPAYLLTFYVLRQKLAILRWSPGQLKMTKIAIGILTASLMVFAGIKDWRDNPFPKNFPVAEPDSAFLLPAQRALVDELKPRMKKGDGFFTMTSEASWYYFLDEACPTRYPYLWTAVTEKAQEEIVRDLRAKKVKWILYRDADWSYRIDDIGNDEKFPVINQYVLKNYQPCFSVEGNEVWVLKGG